MRKFLAILLTVLIGTTGIVFPAFAEGAGPAGVKYTVTPDKTELIKSDLEQTVTYTVKAELTGDVDLRTVTLYIKPPEGMTFSNPKKGDGLRYNDDSDHPEGIFETAKVEMGKGEQEGEVSLIFSGTTEDRNLKESAVLGTFTAAIAANKTGTLTPTFGDHFYGYSMPDGNSSVATEAAVEATGVTVKVEQVTISFDANGGSGTMEAVTVEKGSEYTLPACGFTAPEGKEFDKWDKGAAGGKITASDDLSLKAIWKDLQQVKTPVITSDDNNFTDKATVTISCGTEEAKIYYTTDGSVPTANSTAYSDAFDVTGTCTVKAVALKEGMTNSEVASADFIKNYKVSVTGGAAEPTSAPKDAEITLTAEIPEGQEFDHWDADGLDITDNKFAMLEKDVIVKAVFRFKAPENVTGVPCTAEEDNDGKITGISSAMEYKAEGANEWTGVDEEATEVTGLNKGGYEVRFKVKDDVLASEAVSVVILGHDEIKYTVKHMQQNADDDNYTEHEKEELTGVAGEDTEAKAKEYGGFTARDITQGKIAADGSTVIEIKYDRKMCTVTFDPGNESEIDPVSVRYGAKIALPANPAKAGYVFLGWYTDKNGGEKVTAETRIEKDITLYAHWTVESSGSSGSGSHSGHGGHEKPGETVKPETPESVPFVDVSKDAYYYDAVDWAVKNGITGGVDEEHFVPNAVCTRAQAAAFLWRKAGKPEPAVILMPFKDVPIDSYYYKAVLWAMEQGITNGTSEEAFSPNASCTRAQIVTLLQRAAGKSAVLEESGFKDVNPGAFYHGAVLWAVENGITNGTTEETFSPGEGCTRAQIVTFLYRAR